MFANRINLYTHTHTHTYIYIKIYSYPIIATAIKRLREVSSHIIGTWGDLLHELIRSPRNGSIEVKRSLHLLGSVIVVLICRTTTVWFARSSPPSQSSSCATATSPLPTIDVHKRVSPLRAGSLPRNSAVIEGSHIRLRSVTVDGWMLSNWERILMGRSLNYFKTLY